MDLDGDAEGQLVFGLGDAVVDTEVDYLPIMLLLLTKRILLLAVLDVLLNTLIHQNVRKVIIPLGDIKVSTRSQRIRQALVIVAQIEVQL